MTKEGLPQPAHLQLLEQQETGDLENNQTGKPMVAWVVVVVSGSSISYEDLDDR